MTPLTEALRRAGVTKVNLANKCGVPVGRIRRVLDGEHNARIEKHIATVLNADVAELFGARDTPPTLNIESRWDRFKEANT